MEKAAAARRRRLVELRKLRSMEACKGTVMGVNGLKSETVKKVRGSDFSLNSSSSDHDSSSSSSSSSSNSSSSGSYPDELAVHGGSVAGVRRLAHGVVSVIGRRREMEDAVTIAPSFSSPSTPLSSSYNFYGVYDGHGGAHVANTCRNRMHLILSEEVSKRKLVEGEFHHWEEALKESFKRADADVAGLGDGTVGSTAVVAVVGERKIVVANCGDSRAVLCRGGVAVPLSNDHKPDRPDELERIEAAGGKVINWNGYRVLGVLATSRSIGDYYLKPYVTSEPEIKITDQTDRDEFLILASDGLWDVISNEIACKLVRNCLRKCLPKQFPGSVTGSTAADAAALLAEVALCRGSKDNVSVVVVELKRLRRKSG
ncbi:hypothetical protein LUZ60_000574 [Juncus effusus]|nr:hypothetical protein LUZ60_000574 [Juncus effusus]